MTEFPSTIPVVDMNDFKNEATRGKFIDGVIQAFHNVGFFAVVNTHTGSEAEAMSALDNGYAAAKEFFAAPAEKKDECCAPEFHGERGYVHSEIAQGQTKKDHKEFFHLGESKNVWPKWMDLQGPAEKLLATVNDTRYKIERAISLAIGEKEDFLGGLTTGGTSLMRCIHYHANCPPGVVWAAEHTDIGLFTLLPRSTEEGLQVQTPDGNWANVRVPLNSMVVNCGDKLQNMTNGFFRSSVHRVIAPRDTSLERYSIVFFIHPKDDDSVSPRGPMITASGGAVRFPEATSLELLHHRLMELGLAKRDFSTEFFGRVEKLVADGVAAPSVKRTFDLAKEIMAKELKN